MKTRSIQYLFAKLVYKEVTIRYLNQYIVMLIYWHQFINLTKAKKTLLKLRIVTLRLIVKSEGPITL